MGEKAASVRKPITEFIKRLIVTPRQCFLPSRKGDEGKCLSSPSLQGISVCTAVSTAVAWLGLGARQGPAGSCGMGSSAG